MLLAELKSAPQEVRRPIGGRAGEFAQQKQAAQGKPRVVQIAAALAAGKAAVRLLPRPDVGGVDLTRCLRQLQHAGRQPQRELVQVLIHARHPTLSEHGLSSRLDERSVLRTGQSTFDLVN